MPTNRKTTIFRISGTGIGYQIIVSACFVSWYLIKQNVLSDSVQ